MVIKLKADLKLFNTGFILLHTGQKIPIFGLHIKHGTI